MAFCTHCGHSVADGDAFCNACGAAISGAGSEKRAAAGPASRSCSKCAAVIQPDNAYCTRCGTAAPPISAGDGSTDRAEPVGHVGAGTASAAAVSQQPSAYNPSGVPRSRLLLVAAIAIVVAAGVWLGWNQFSSTDADETAGSTTTNAEAMDPDETTTVPDEQDSEDDGTALISDGKLTVCSEVPWEPFEFEDPSSPSGYSGFDIELMSAIATEMELEFVVANTPFNAIWLQPGAGACDVVASAMTITEERAEYALFSDPYFDAAQSFLVTATNSGLTLAGTDGMRIGVQTGTTGEIYATENKPAGAELVSFDEGAALFLALESGSIDAILQDLPVNGYRAAQDANFVVTETYSTDEQYGFGLALENDGLAGQINDALKALKDSGAYSDLHMKYFTTPGS